MDGGSDVSVLASHLYIGTCGRKGRTCPVYVTDGSSTNGRSVRRSQVVRLCFSRMGQTSVTESWGRDNRELRSSNNIPDRTFNTQRIAVEIGEG